MRVRYKVVESEAVDLHPQDCNNEKLVQEASLPAVQDSFPGCNCSVWHDQCWKTIDEHVIARLVANGSHLKIIRKPATDILACS